MKITLPGSIRSKKNSKQVFCKGKYPVVIPSKAYGVWEAQARLALSMQLRGLTPTTEDVHLKVTAYYKGQKPDLSGVLESIGDCLEGYVYKNDKQIVSWDGSRLVHDKANPRTEVEIWT